MHFGISTHLLKEEPIFRALESIAETGFKAAEVWAADLFKNGESPKNIARTAQIHALRLSLHGPAIEIDVSNPDILDRSLKRIFKAIRVAGEIDAATMVIHPARRLSKKDDMQEYWRQTEAGLECINQWAKNRNVLIALEVMDGAKAAQVIIRPEEVGRVMAYGFSNVRICLDLAHVQPIMAPAKYLDRIDPSWLCHVHLSDRSHLKRHLPLGEGDLPIDDVLRRLHRFYKGVVIIEGRVKGHGKEVVRANYEYLQRHGWTV